MVESVWDCFLKRDAAGMLRKIRPDSTIWGVVQPDRVRRETLERYVAVDFPQSVRFTTRFSYQPPSAISGRGRTTVLLRRRRLVHAHEGARPSGPRPY